MSETYLIERDTDHHPIRSIELVDSPDDGGWYAKQWDFRQPRATRLSLGIYRSRSSLIAAIEQKAIRWERRRK